MTIATPARTRPATIVPSRRKQSVACRSIQAFARQPGLTQPTSDVAAAPVAAKMVQRRSPLYPQILIVREKGEIVSQRSRWWQINAGGYRPRHYCSRSEETVRSLPVHTDLCPPTWSRPTDKRRSGGTCGRQDGAGQCWQRLMVPGRTARWRAEDARHYIPRS